MLDVREATLEDRREIWEWWNDPVTRQMMKKNDYVPWEEHCTWYEKVLEDPNRILCMGLLDGAKVGVVRFDLRGPEDYEVSINLNPAFRGRGIGSSLLERSVTFFKTIRKANRLWASCKKSNMASRRSFEKAGFLVLPNETFEGMNEFYMEFDLTGD